MKKKRACLIKKIKYRVRIADMTGRYKTMQIRNIIIHALIALLMVLGFYAIMKGKYIEKTINTTNIRTNVVDERGGMIAQYHSDSSFFDSRYELKFIKKVAK